MSKARKGHSRKPTTTKGKKPGSTAAPPRLLGGLGQGTKETSQAPTRKERRKTLLSERAAERVKESERAIARAKKGGNQAQLLTQLHDPALIIRELQTVEMAVAKGWNIRQKDMIRSRLLRIMRKETAEVMTKHGLVESESAADEMALKASSILERMDSADVDRLKVFKGFADGKPEPQPPPTVNIINNNVNTNSDDRNALLAQLLERFGASESDRGEGSSSASSVIDSTANDLSEDDRDA